MCTFYLIVSRSSWEIFIISREEDLWNNETTEFGLYNKDTQTLSKFAVDFYSELFF